MEDLLLKEKPTKLSLGSPKRAPRIDQSDLANVNR
jgi:hypothetical protein